MKKLTPVRQAHPTTIAQASKITNPTPMKASPSQPKRFSGPTKMSDPKVRNNMPRKGFKPSKSTCAPAYK